MSWFPKTLAVILTVSFVCVLHGRHSMVGGTIWLSTAMAYNFASALAAC